MEPMTKSIKSNSCLPSPVSLAFFSIIHLLHPSQKRACKLPICLQSKRAWTPGRIGCKSTSLGGWLSALTPGSIPVHQNLAVGYLPTPLQAIELAQLWAVAALPTWERGSSFPSFSYALNPWTAHTQLRLHAIMHLINVLKKKGKKHMQQRKK